MDMKTVEELYSKIAVLQTRALELHRERYKTSGTYDKTKCEQLVADIQAMARLISATTVNLEADFADFNKETK